MSDAERRAVIERVVALLRAERERNARVVATALAELRAQSAAAKQ